MVARINRVQSEQLSEQPLAPTVAMENWEGEKFRAQLNDILPVVGFKSYERYIWNTDVLRVEILVEDRLVYLFHDCTL